MSVKIKFKHQLLFLLAGLVVVTCMSFLLSYVLKGPRLGPHYDFLLKFKPSPLVSHEILLINSDDYLENNDIFTVLLVLTEMEGQALVMTGNLSPLASPVTVTETEVRRRFLDEFSLIGSNIRNLFEAIRMGTVTPSNAPDFVEKLVELTDHGKDRLLAALIDRDEAFLLSIAVFGNYFEVMEADKRDRDGVLRRVQPVNMENYEEHPVYTYLKSRYAISRIETFEEEKKVLWLRETYNQNNEEEDKEIDIVLDDNANIITPWNVKFRSIDISLFREYEEQSRIIRSALEDADARGAFSVILPERSPLFLSDYALMAREDMLRSPTEENVIAWKKSRDNYFKSLSEFLSGNAESNLIKGYEDVIYEESHLGDEGLAALAGMRDGLIQFFIYMREEYEKFIKIKSDLEIVISDSFCIIGPPENTAYSALLANAILTKNHIIPIEYKFVLFWSLLAGFIACVLVFYLKPWALVFAGFGLNILSLVFFSSVFIYKSIWIDPLIGFSAGFSGVLTIFIIKTMVINYRAKLFRFSYGSSVPQKTLSKLIQEGQPHPKETRESFASIVAIRDINLLYMEDKEKPNEAGTLRKAFFNNVKNAVFNRDGVIAGFEGDTILACFGSPLNKTDKPIYKACSFVKEIMENTSNSWRFGIDAGNCTFYWSHETGFAAHGRPAIRARLLASRTARLKARALVTEYVSRKINIPTEKIDTLNTGNIYILL